MTTAELLETARRVEVRTICLGNGTLVGEFAVDEFRRLGLACFILSLLFLCSCSTQPRVIPAKQLPAEVFMNKEAGRGGHLTVMLKFNGEELLFLVDSGAPVTTLDKSLEGKLGKG